MAMGNNPIMMIDPDGMEELPNDFIGPPNVDDWFQADRVANNNWFQFASSNFFNNYEATTFSGDDWFMPSLTSFFGNNPQRPDADGFVSVTEGVEWARAHPNAGDNFPLYIDAGQLDFGNISTVSIAQLNTITPINTLNEGNLKAALTNERVRGTVYALGRVNIILHSRKTGAISIVNDEATDYDWNLGGSSLRRYLIQKERNRTGLNDTHGFKAFYYGTGTIITPTTRRYCK
jgi:hypothetical protein